MCSHRNRSIFTCAMAAKEMPKANTPQTSLIVCLKTFRETLLGHSVFEIG